MFTVYDSGKAVLDGKECAADLYIENGRLYASADTWSEVYFTSCSYDEKHLIFGCGIQDGRKAEVVSAADKYIDKVRIE